MNSLRRWILTPVVLSAVMALSAVAGAQQDPYGGGFESDPYSCDPYADESCDTSDCAETPDAVACEDYLAFEDVDFDYANPYEDQAEAARGWFDVRVWLFGSIGVVTAIAVLAWGYRGRSRRPAPYRRW